MTKDKDGNFVFRTQNETFLFTRESYNRHCKKHPRLNFDKYLEGVDVALVDPDHITIDPADGQKTFYKVINIINPRFDTYVEVWKIPTFKKGKSFNIIATAFTFWALSWQVIHSLEKTLWKKEGSLI
ncbi:MAG: hypothetical protein Q8R55_02460 [Candidatus Taylorbacteria bacterium]|nr:hypothetical protein [Candidatus Taylorbacteria bacterium]